MTFVVLLTAIGLAVALALSLRQIAQLTAVPNQPGPNVPRRPDELAAARLAGAAIMAPVGILIVDTAGETVFVNEVAAGHTSPGTEDAVVGLRLRNVIAEGVTSNQSVEQEIELFNPSQRTISLRTEPLTEESVRLGTVIFIEDLTSRSHIEAMRRDFIANASHELKTPLGALRLLAEALAATEDPQTRIDLGDRINTEAARMTRLVEDILDLALLEEGQQTNERVDVCEMIEQALEQTNLLSETLGIGVRSSCETADVIGDRRHLVAALANLIENSLTYTYAKGPAHLEPVEVRSVVSDTTVTIEIEDKGIGIPERHQDRIFERFYRIDRGRSRVSGGTGLGLAIVRHIVHNHGGHVDVESAPAVGSVFRVALPLPPETARQG